MYIEAAAKAMFDTFHARFDRMRNWARHPDADTLEPGRESFRDMARAVEAMLGMPVEEAPVAEVAAEPVAEPVAAEATDEHP